MPAKNIINHCISMICLFCKPFSEAAGDLTKQEDRRRKQSRAVSRHGEPSSRATYDLNVLQKWRNFNMFVITRTVPNIDFTPYPEALPTAS
jgi:hypothetical protein